MSQDALSNLVQRTLQPEPALRPRLPSRYEGGRGEPHNEVERDEIAAPPPAAYRSSTSAPDSVPGSPRADPARGETPLAEPGRRRPDDSPVERAAALPPRVTDERATVAATPQLSTGTRQGPDPAEARIFRGGLTADPVGMGSPAGKPPLPAEQVRPAERMRASQQQTNDPIPRAAAMAPATVAIPDAPPRPEPESVVHITIGRVEVRAAPSTFPPRSPHKPQERRVMSLEEYLDRRGRGSSP